MVTYLMSSAKYTLIKTLLKGVFIFEKQAAIDYSTTVSGPVYSISCHRAGANLGWPVSSWSYRSIISGQDILRVDLPDQHSYEWCYLVKKETWLKKTNNTPGVDRLMDPLPGAGPVYSCFCL